MIEIMAEKVKYINEDELSRNLDIMRYPYSEFATDDYIDGFSDGISAAIKELEAFPAADVEPVRHGHWISEDSKIFKCSECDYEFEHEGYTQFFNFCPNCGAKMDGGEGE